MGGHALPCVDDLQCDYRIVRTANSTIMFARTIRFEFDFDKAFGGVLQSVTEDVHDYPSEGSWLRDKNPVFDGLPRRDFEDNVDILDRLVCDTIENQLPRVISGQTILEYLSSCDPFYNLLGDCGKVDITINVQRRL